eukprot:scaffold16454_cov68-Phaeocystis_antarctica.AAC.2
MAAAAMAVVATGMRTKSYRRGSTQALRMPCTLHRVRGCTGRPPTCLARCGARIVDCRPSGARRLHGAARWREVARGGLRAPTAAGEVGGAGVRAFLARQRRAGTLRAVRARLAGDARLLAFFVLVRAGCAPFARTLACEGLDGAGAALGLIGAARRRKASLVGWRALTGTREVGGDRVRALRARQRRAGARWAVRALLAGNARLFALAGLVRACRTPIARALACDGLDVARTTLGLLGAARRCIVARISRLALVSAAQVSGARVRALAARQWRRRALRAVRARHAHVALGPAGYVHELACVALVARGLLFLWLHGTRAARRRIGAARGCVRAWQGWSALAIGAEVGLVGVRARRARQHDAGTLGAVRAGHASNTCLLASAGLVRADRAPVACAHACVGLDGAGAAPGWLDAASRRVGSWRYIFATSRITQAGEIAPRATRARYTPHAPHLAVVALLACGRSDSARCSAHGAGRAEGGAQTAGLL